MDSIEERAASLLADVQAGKLPASEVPMSAIADPRAIRVFDDVLPDPGSYRAMALAQSFHDVSVGAATFHNIAECPSDELLEWITQHFSNATPTLSFFRKSPLWQIEPNFIHTDRDMGDWSGIFYLNPHPPYEDGTRFWRHRVSGATASVSATDEARFAEGLEWRRLEAWEPWDRCQARFNRLLLFPASCFHSRAIDDNYGSGDDARLIQIVFGKGHLS
jgi:hypothetical protein